MVLKWVTNLRTKIILVVGLPVSHIERREIRIKEMFISKKYTHFHLVSITSVYFYLKLYSGIEPRNSTQHYNSNRWKTAINDYSAAVNKCTSVGIMFITLLLMYMLFM